MTILIEAGLFHTGDRYFVEVGDRSLVRSPLTPLKKGGTGVGDRFFVEMGDRFLDGNGRSLFWRVGGRSHEWQTDIFRKRKNGVSIR